MELRPLCVFLLMTGLIHCTQTGQGVQGGTDRETEGVTGDGEIKQETARPKPAVKVQPAEHVFIGETVTLTCEIQTGESWRYLWYRNNEELSDAAGKKTHTITDIKDSDKGDYTCNGTQSSDPKYTQTSDAVTLTVSESPKPEVIIKPDTQVFIGERVTFRCDIKGGDIEWTYDWYRDDKTFNLSLTAQEIIISDYHSGNYTCRGRRRSDSQISKTSDPVTLTVSEKPKPQLTSSREGPALTGTSLTLYCTLKPPSAGWKFYWIKPTQSTETETKTHSYTISPGTVSDRGYYKCRAGRGNPVYYTHYSNELRVDVIVRPKPVVIIKPDTQVYSGERVTLRCNIQGERDTQWTYSWYKNEIEYRHHTTQEFTISSVTDSDSGKYTCRRSRSSYYQISEISDAVILTVSEKPKPELTSSLKGAVLIGNSVTLYCTLKPPSDGWKFYWSKHTQSTETETKTHSYTIRSVSVSDRGYYWCRAGRRNRVYTDYSDALWVNVTESPKPVVIIKPDTQVFIGERVTFRCEIQGGDTEWTYDWYRNDHTFYTSHTTQEIIIRDYDSGNYTCRGRRRSDSQISKMSDPVTLTVSEKPKPQLTSSLKGDVLTGNSVTLYCTLKSPSDGWKFYWSKRRQRTETETDTETDSYSRSVSVYDGGHYKCRAGRGNPAYYTDYSNELRVDVIVRPKPVVIIKPDTQVYSGEKVTLRCNIQGGGDTQWTYSFYKNDIEYRHHTTQDLITSSVTDSDSGKYTCRRSNSSYYQISEISDAVTLTVSEKPKPQLTSDLKGDVLTGNSVTLSCTLKLPSDGWKFYWSNHTQSPESETETDTYNISSVSVYDGGQYWCRAGRGNPVYYTHYSDALWVNVTESPKPVVIIKPDTQVFRGERVTFRCEIQGGNTEWTYDWYRNDNTFNPSHTTQEISISDYDSGKYTCRGRRRSDSQISKTSDPVTLTVSEKPKPQLTSDLKGAALTGNSVNLSCTLTPQSAGWKFYWSKHTQNPETETETHHYTINSVNVSDGGQYWCRAGRGNAVYYTDYSDALWVNVTESPKAVVTIKPDKHVFRGETVTLTCEIQGGGDTEWKYSWNKKDKTFYPSPTTQEFSFSSVINNNSGEYTCRGWRCSDNQRSEISDAVTLTVSDAAEAVVSVSPLRWLTEGDSVTLSCEVKNSSTGWTFSWYTAVPYRNGLIEVTGHRGNVLYGSELLSDSSRGSGGSYTLTNVTVNHTGVYMCRAERGESVFHTRDSNLQPLCITGESPPVSLIINPSRTQHFTADSLSLSCEDQSDSTGWTVRGYTHNETLFECSSDSGSTCNISSLSTSHSGVYWCQSESGRRSNPVNITVHNGDVILDSPVHPKGNPLILRCLYRNSGISDSGVDFYKDSSVLQKKTTGEMAIITVSKSDEGFYHCKHPERGESPKSWVSVRASAGYSAVIIGLSLAFLFVILMIVLILLLHFKKKKGVEYQPPSTVNQDTSQPADGENVYENVAVRTTVDSAAGSSSTSMCSQVVTRKKKQNDDAVRRPGDVIYSQIEMKNVNPHSKDDSASRPSDVVYSMIASKNMRPNDDASKLDDVTYADIDLKKTKKPNRKQGKRTEGADTVYSELKQNTDKGDFTETADATYAQVRKKGKKYNAG
ncbi:basement membrane-specific heparan sulfate proteoglycan core protein isoform X2 [Ictalurus punctatus]|uniref:Basement membrane-specific heparan sulfate proteoglycan core protein isoform X2 n=2 Tax=Ictalurus punctatus TaxID=7998 RepID=A0A9F7RIP3_ICTPU|nr:basement membrane-specific heparan sulfate proteoglycan core protein isoform X2 [Ictalurus punctatus]